MRLSFSKLERVLAEEFRDETITGREQRMEGQTPEGVYCVITQYDDQQGHYSSTVFDRCAQNGERKNWPKVLIAHNPEEAAKLHYKLLKKYAREERKNPSRRLPQFSL